MTRKKKKTKKVKVSKEFNKYFYYEESVQSPKTDVKFFSKTYESIRGKKPLVLREDFCGTHLICCEWVKQSDKHIAHGVDLDPEPIEYGVQNHEVKLKQNQLDRLYIHTMSVMDKNLPSADIAVAPNFSYFLFKERSDLKEYFTNAHKALNPNGIFIVDCFGGIHCMEPNEEEIVGKDYSYFWDQDSFNPVTNEAMFYIHFKRKGEKKREKVFTYDWRMWGIAELKDIFKEAGFSKVTVYWELDDKKGEGSGIFKPTTKGDDADAWIAYLVAEK
ncbi:MAG: class I SAM-dependent methyltransferase [Bdellovibrionales bacterium]|nr:class I SAM-dependent methyltransferase [Bdellovibrionales bacterium]